jgi:hypothetical protein
MTTADDATRHDRSERLVVVRDGLSDQLLPRRSTRPGVSGLGLLGLISILGCSSGDPRDPGAFCERLRSQQTVVAVAPVDADGVDALLRVFRDLDGRAPLQIRDDWAALTDVLGLAASTDLSDAEASEVLFERIYAVETAAASVRRYVSDTCGITIGPLPDPAPVITEAPDTTAG